MFLESPLIAFRRQNEIRSKVIIVNIPLPVNMKAGNSMDNLAQHDHILNKANQLGLTIKKHGKLKSIYHVKILI